MPGGNLRIDYRVSPDHQQFRGFDFTAEATVDFYRKVVTEFSRYRRVWKKHRPGRIALDKRWSFFVSCVGHSGITPLNQIIAYHRGTANKSGTLASYNPATLLCYPELFMVPR